jgi:hypothetical protein
MAVPANWKRYLKLSRLPCAAFLVPPTAAPEGARLPIVNDESGNWVRSYFAKRAS